jgi:hypothetical protein
MFIASGGAPTFCIWAHAAVIRPRLPATQSKTLNPILRLWAREFGIIGYVSLVVVVGIRIVVKSNMIGSVRTLSSCTPA